MKEGSVKVRLDEDRNRSMVMEGKLKNQLKEMQIDEFLVAVRMLENFLRVKFWRDKTFWNRIQRETLLNHLNLILSIINL